MEIQTIRQAPGRIEAGMRAVHPASAWPRQGANDTEINPFLRFSQCPTLALRNNPASIDFQIKLLGALSVGDVRTGTIPSLLPSQKHYLKVYSVLRCLSHPALTGGLEYECRRMAGEALPDGRGESIILIWTGTGEEYNVLTKSERNTQRRVYIDDTETGDLQV
ncbi:MAG: hypothetical protein V1736_10120 [Pseudomonadota bacterium]